MRENLGVHESLELHEIVSFKSLCLTKAAIMQNLVSDEELKKLMQEIVKKDVKQMEELREYKSQEGSH